MSKEKKASVSLKLKSAEGKDICIMKELVELWRESADEDEKANLVFVKFSKTPYEVSTSIEDISKQMDEY